MRSKFDRFWACADTLLLAAVLLLLATLGVEFYRSSQKTMPAPQPAAAPRARAVAGQRVSHGNLDAIARNMINSGWDAPTRSPAMDIRESGHSFLVSLALPQQTIEESVQVAANGNLLTLRLRTLASDQMLVQRVRLPCAINREQNISTTISNNVLHVKVSP